jgi:hypothetical protein
MTNNNIESEFRTPPPSMRGAPFWSWNDRLQVPELARQVEDMKAHGMGGFFMHSREGLETPYLGDEWMECIRETVKKAKETGMNAWLYDEDRWPSGYAGGRVPARGGDAFRAKLLTLEETAELPTEPYLALFAAVIEEDTILSARRLDAPAPLNPGETYLVFRREISQPSEWFNDDAYADNLNPDSVKAFIDITYEAYKREVGAEFGKAVPGIFTDEPNIISHHQPSGRRCLPWTDGLLEFFQERRGWDLRGALPWLFDNPNDEDRALASRARHDFWWTISERFTSAYSQQLGEWCEKNGLSFTGHFLYEQEMGYGIRTGGAIMPHYRWQHVPGIDMLTEQNREFLTIKQCSSMASQFNRPRVLSETYGCSGWEFTFEGQKWNGDWQYVLGVNMRCQHLALYSLRGCRKRDYPPTFNYNTTWWKYNGVVEDYFARVGRVTSAGRAVRDVLLLHPVSTGWSMLGQGEAEAERVNAYSERLNLFVQALLATHYDFDFGDEQIMASEARVSQKRMIIGQCAYPLVVVPPEMRTLLHSTYELLQRYLATGGKVIVVGALPDQIEAQPAPQLRALWQHPGVTVIPDAAALQATLEAHLPRRISLLTQWGQQAAPLLYMQRAWEDGRQAFFIVNNQRETGYEVDVSLELPSGASMSPKGDSASMSPKGDSASMSPKGDNPAGGLGRLEEWDPLTGEIHALAAERDGGRLRFKASFSPAGSKIYVVDPQGEALAPQPADSRFSRLTATGREGENAVYIGPSCSFQRTDPNILTLDKCRYRMEDGEWSDEMDLWRAQQQVRNALGMRQVFYNGLPQRYRWALNNHPQDGERVELRFAFAVRTVPAHPVDLVVENPQWFRIRLNGQPVSSEPSGWYLDRSFERVTLPPFRVGPNDLILDVDGYTNYMELEDLYLAGDFAVSPIREIRSEPPRLHFGDWTTQGYLHYAGGMIYHQPFDYDPATRATLVLGEVRAVDVAVHVNGQIAGHIPWAGASTSPWGINANGFDLTPHLRPGANEIGIEVVSSPRNMLGPLHLATGRERWTDWRSFRRTDHTYTPGYVVQPWGLVGQAKILIAK